MCLFWRESAIIRALLVLFISLQLCHFANASSQLPTAENGVLDLRDWDFDAHEPLELAGQWEFYWQTFLDPTTIEQSTVTPDYIRVPGVWLGHIIDGKPLGKYGYATYRLKILLPENPIDLALHLKRVQSAYRVYVNGQLWMHSGTPGKTAEAEKPIVVRELGRFKGASGTLDLVAHVSNHVGYAGGGFFNSVTLGTEQHQHQHHLFELSRDVFLSGALLCLGGFLLILHLGRFREKTYFVLYVMSFWSAVYMATVTSTLVELFPAVPWVLNERLSYVAAAFLIALTYEFIYQVCPRRTSLILSHIILYQAALISLFVILWPGGLPSETLYLFTLHLGVVSISCAVEVHYILVKKVTGALLIVFGVATLVVFGVHDILHANGFIRTVYLGPYGILILLFFYAAILALRVNDSITRNEQMAEAIRSLTDGVAIYDRWDQIVVWNDAYWQQLTEPARKLLKPGRPFLELVQADAYSGELPGALGQEQNYIQKRMQNHQNPGSTFEVERLGGWYLYREAKTPDGGRVTLATNLTQQKEKEAELQAALEKVSAANEAKNSFLSNMSHELRTPLNAINGFSDMMVNGVLGPLNTQYQDYAGHISRSGKHLLRLVTDMLDVARIESGKLRVIPEQIDLTELLEDCFRMEAEKLEARKLIFTQTIPDDLPPLYVDPLRVRQIILNLLDNAIKFTDIGGEISVKVDVAPNDAVRIKIQDTGIGIAPENIEIALQKFGQIRQSHLNAHDGLGLGLSIAKIFMQLHGGTLDLQSRVGEGTTITLTFLSPEQSTQFFGVQEMRA